MERVTCQNRRLPKGRTCFCWDFRGLILGATLHPAAKVPLAQPVQGFPTFSALSCESWDEADTWLSTACKRGITWMSWALSSNWGESILCKAFPLLKQKQKSHELSSVDLVKEAQSTGGSIHDIKDPSSLLNGFIVLGSHLAVNGSLWRYETPKQTFVEN